jgi:hypothetical protein
VLQQDEVPERQVNEEQLGGRARLVPVHAMKRVTLYG